jgi:hypothetical protein
MRVSEPMKGEERLDVDEQMVASQSGADREEAAGW